MIRYDQPVHGRGRQGQQSSSGKTSGKCAGGCNQLQVADYEHHTFMKLAMDSKTYWLYQIRSNVWKVPTNSPIICCHHLWLSWLLNEKRLVFKTWEVFKADIFQHAENIDMICIGETRFANKEGKWINSWKKNLYLKVNLWTCTCETRVVREEVEESESEWINEKVKVD